jgi:hypothetical protein
VGSANKARTSALTLLAALRLPLRAAPQARVETQEASAVEEFAAK